MIRPLSPSASMSFPGEELNLYLRDIGKTPILGREEELDLVTRARAGDRRALNALVRANLRFVVSVALAYRNRGLPLGDLVNEGNIGLLRAVDRFDPAQGVKFISYAVWWIRQGILAALGRMYRRMEDPAGEEFLDSAPAPEEFAADAALERQSVEKQARAAVESLPHREREVLRRFYGIGTGHADTLEEIGTDMGLSRERIRQIKAAGLARLRNPGSLHELRGTGKMPAEAR